MLPNPRIYVLPRRITHPTIQVAPLSEHMPLIAIHAMSIPQRRVGDIRIDGIIHGVFRPGDKEDGDAFEASDVAGRDEGGEERTVGGNGPDSAHVHEVSEGGHGGAAEEVRKLVVSGFVEAVMRPEAELESMLANDAWKIPSPFLPSFLTVSSLLRYVGCKIRLTDQRPTNSYDIPPTHKSPS